tara:strand:- start:3668 stop:4216 length:549 start_codon:yes stop_codon:yes gene_type:complete
MRSTLEKTCLHCGKEFTVTTMEKRKKFCTRRCAALYNNANRKPFSEEQKSEISSKISNSLKEYWKNNPDKIRKGEEQAKAVAKGTRGKYKRQPKSIMSLSSRTRSKIMQRLKAECCVCGWKEGTCDLHHINGKKIDNPHSHSNLCCVCPNHHRLIHENNVDESELKTFEEQFGDLWVEFYYG